MSILAARSLLRGCQNDASILPLRTTAPAVAAVTLLRSFSGAHMPSATYDLPATLEDDPPEDSGRSRNLPTRHSRKSLPHVVTDTNQLLDWSQEILEDKKRIGSLYTYSFGLDKSEDAWLAADTSVQKVEALIRGCAFAVEGTIWNRWCKEPQQGDPIDAVEAMALQEKLLVRMNQEGYAYMEVRDMKLKEVFGEKKADPKKPILEEQKERPKDDMFDDETKLALGLTDTPDDGGGEEPQEEQLALPMSYMDDFALPGPTTMMLDTMLDTLACHAPNCTDALAHIELANVMHNLMITRHMCDGGDGTNLNPHTRPTAATFNALIRNAAAVPYDESNIELRDFAVSSALVTLQAMNECRIIHRNSAAFVYAIQAMDKYLPTSRIKGNILGGIFLQCRRDRLISKKVTEAYTAANEISNSEDHDAFVESMCRDPDSLYKKFSHFSKKYRFHPEDDTY